MRLPLALVMLLSALLAVSLPADAAATGLLREVDFEQKLDARLPSGRTFVDASGTSVALGDLLGERPAFLVLAYFRCPNLCGTMLRTVARSLAPLPMTAGRDFDARFPSDSVQSVLVNQAFVRAYGIDRPLGRRLEGFGSFFGVVLDVLRKHADFLAGHVLYFDGLVDWDHLFGDEAHDLLSAAALLLFFLLCVGVGRLNLLFVLFVGHGVLLWL